MTPRLEALKAAHNRSDEFAPIEDAIAAIRAGEMVIVADDEDRENEGDLTMAAEKITPEAINFMAKYGRGLICLAMTPERLDELEIPLMVSKNWSRFETAFCVSIEARERTTTGISAADRAATVLAAMDPATKPADLIRPGHMFPLRARNAGVLARAGQTEAAVDLARLAGLHPAGVICEIMSEDGTMARVPELRQFAMRHNIKLITVADLITYRLRTESVVKCVASAKLPTEYGEFRAPRIRKSDRQANPYCSCVRRYWRWPGRACARAFAVSHGRCVAFRALRLRCAARQSLVPNIQ